MAKIAEALAACKSKWSLEAHTLRELRGFAGETLCIDKKCPREDTKARRMISRQDAKPPRVLSMRGPRLVAHALLRADGARRSSDSMIAACDAPLASWRLGVKKHFNAPLESLEFVPISKGHSRLGVLRTFGARPPIENGTDHTGFVHFVSPKRHDCDVF